MYSMLPKTECAVTAFVSLRLWEKLVNLFQFLFGIRMPNPMITALMHSFDFNDEEVFASYLEYATNPVNSMTYNIRITDVTTDDTILTLSTCMDNIATSRYLVQGVLISDEPVG